MTKQFELRVPVLAQMFGVSIAAAEANEFYDDRSAFVHGRFPKYTEVSGKKMEWYNRFETALRLCLLRASTDKAFCAQFQTDATIIGAFGSV